jgi:hypothetical protein
MQQRAHSCVTSRAWPVRAIQALEGPTGFRYFLDQLVSAQAQADDAIRHPMQTHHGPWAMGDGCMGVTCYRLALALGPGCPQAGGRF